MSYSKDAAFEIPADCKPKFGSMVKMRTFVGKHSSLDTRFVESCEAMSVTHPRVGRICTIRVSNTNIECFELAQCFFNLYFCRQTTDCLRDPMPAPVFYAMETAKRAQQVFLSRV